MRCPDCDDSLPIVLHSIGSPGTPARGWDPGDPGESPDWEWLYPKTPGCPRSFYEPDECDFWPGSDYYGGEARATSRGIAMDTGESRFDNTLESIIGDACAEIAAGYGPDPDTWYDERRERDFERGAAKRWGGIDD